MTMTDLEALFPEPVRDLEDGEFWCVYHGYAKATLCQGKCDTCETEERAGKATYCKTCLRRTGTDSGNCDYCGQPVEARPAVAQSSEELSRPDGGSDGGVRVVEGILQKDGVGRGQSVLGTTESGPVVSENSGTDGDSVRSPSGGVSGEASKSGRFARAGD